MSRRCIVRAASSLLPLAGCSLLVPQSPPQLYRLTMRIDDAPHQPLGPGPPLHGQLVIVVPEAPHSLDTDRIALTRNRTTLDYFAGSAWTDRAPGLLQGLLVQAFENSGRIVAVGSDSMDLTPDYLLETELRDFEAHYAETSDQPPTIAVTVDVKLVKMPDRRIIAGILAAENAPAPRNDLDGIVVAFDIAVGRVLARIVEWALRAMAHGR